MSQRFSRTQQDNSLRQADNTHNRYFLTIAVAGSLSPSPPSIQRLDKHGLVNQALPARCYQALPNRDLYKRGELKFHTGKL